jgi:DNA repair protein SbcD/Mre11
MPRLLHLADLHLGWTPRDLPVALADARRAQRDARLREAVDLALRERVHAVLIAGDLFETHDPPGDVVRDAREALGRLVAAGIQVVTVPGNHDELTYARSVYRREAERWPGLLVRSPMPARIGELVLDGETVHLHGLAYHGGVTDVRNALADLPDTSAAGRHLFLAHGTLVHALADAVDERSLPLPRAALAAAGYAYAALGHVHAPSEQRLGGALTVYPGCVGGKGFDDPGADAWTLVDLGAHGARVVRRPHAAPALRDLTLDVSACDDEDGVAEALQGLVARHAGDLLRVRLRGALPAPLDLEELALRCGDEAFHLRLEDHTSSVSPALLDAWGASPTVRGAFVRRLRARLGASDDPAERERVTRALRLGLDALAGGR